MIEGHGIDVMELSQRADSSCIHSGCRRRDGLEDKEGEPGPGIDHQEKIEQESS